MEVGILDPEGRFFNPLNGREYSEQYKILAKFWSTLPFYSKRYEAIRMFKNKQVTLIVSGTGSGKSVLAPKYMLHALDYEGKIAVTNPKRLAAYGVADFAAKCLDVELGTYVSIKFRGSDPKDFNPNSNLVYCTDGYILQKLNFDPLLSDYDCVIIDEAHERNINIDLLLMKLKYLCQQRSDFRLIIMSATIDIDLFSNYYKQFKFGFLDAGEKTFFPIREFFAKKPVLKIDKNRNITSNPNNYIDALVNISYDIITDTSYGDILVFVTGGSEGDKCCGKLRQKLQDDKTVFCKSLSSSTSKEDEDLIKDPELYKQGTTYTRKIIFSTEVAESSVTIEGLKYVVDSGLVNSSSFSYKDNLERLDRTCISRASHKQRKGRVGRKEPGICYNLFTKEQYEKSFPEFTISPILNQNITTEIFRIIYNEDYISVIPTKFSYKNAHSDLSTPTNLETFLNGFIERPPELTIQSILDTMFELDALEVIVKKQYDITLTGYFMNSFGLYPNISRMLVEGYVNQCLNEVLIIAAFMEATDNRLNALIIDDKNAIDISKDVTDKVYKDRIKVISSNYGDLMSVINIFKRWYTLDDKDRLIFCNYYFIKHKTLEKINKVINDYKRNYAEIVKAMTKFLKQEKDKTLEEGIVLSIVSGYFMNMINKNKKVWKMYKSNMTGSIDKTSLSNNIKNFKDAIFIVNKSIFNRKNFSLITVL